MEESVCKISRWQILKNQLNNLSPEGFKSVLLENPDAIILDVRTVAEYANGHIEGAIHIDYFAEDFWDKIEQLNTSRLYLVYCRSSRRSIRVCTLMKNGGFTNVYNLESGIKDWPQAISQPISQL